MRWRGAVASVGACASATVAVKAHPTAVASVLMRLLPLGIRARQAYTRPRPTQSSIVLALAPMMLASLAAAALLAPAPPIDRQALIARHAPVVERVEPDASLTVGNGRFAFTADAT